MISLPFTIPRPIIRAALGITAVALVVWSARAFIARRDARLGDAIRADITASAKASIDSADAETAQLANQNAALRRELARADTVLDVALARARRETVKPVAPPPVVGPVLAPAIPLVIDTNAVSSCRATLDGLATACAQYRETADRERAHSDSLLRASRASFAAFSLAMATRRQTDSVTIARQIRAAARDARLDQVEHTALATSVLVNIIQWKARQWGLTK